jgi:hypothetical protein
MFANGDGMQIVDGRTVNHREWRLWLLIETGGETGCKLRQTKLENQSCKWSIKGGLSGPVRCHGSNHVLITT